MAHYHPAGFIVTMPQRVPGAHNICTPVGVYNAAPPELIHRLSTALKKWDGEVVAAVGPSEVIAPLP